jgi:hypothetical protein
MKEMLLAPIPQRKFVSNQAKTVESDDMDTKYKNAMGFGTPNIRPAKRMKHLNQDQLKSHITLQRFCIPTASGGQSKEDEERDSNDFKKSSASEFLKRTRAAELKMKSEHEKETEAEKNRDPEKPPNSKEAVKRRLLKFDI